MLKPVQKQFHVSPSFPLSFVYRDTKPRHRELPDHLHDWHEIVYVHRGKGTFFIDRTFYDMRAGDLFLIPGNTVHRAMPDTEDPVTSTAVFFHPILTQMPSLGESFSYLQCFDQCRLNRTYLIACSAALQQVMEHRLQNIQEELRAAMIGVRHAATLQVQQILLAVNRELTVERGDAQPSPAIGPIWMRNALLYLDAHYMERIGLRELCKRASVSPAHFSRVFKQLTGMNVTEYIAARRIMKAKELLLETDHNIGVIAADCGFDNLPHFHRMFKRIVGKTPASYRRNPEI